MAKKSIFITASLLLGYQWIVQASESLALEDYVADQLSIKDLDLRDCDTEQYGGTQV